MSDGTVWLAAEYASHSFHYRMPETVAISSVNPTLPSPLSVQMALVAAYLRENDRERAEALTALLPLPLRLRPAAGALVFRAIMRYVRPPKNPADRDSGTGAQYKISPHYREFALLEGPLTVYVRVPPDGLELVRDALERVPYLGAKDSLVACLGVQEVDAPPSDCARPIEDFAEVGPGVIVQLATLERPARLEALVPGSRDPKDYAVGPYWLPGRLTSQGTVKVYRRDAANRGLDVAGPAL